MEKFKNIAILIDAENAQKDSIEPMLKIISEYGHITVRKAYGNWTTDGLKNWKELLKTSSIKQEQYCACVKGKNTSDIALTIGAMDLLHKDKFDAFVLVSSDSDYIPLVMRLHDDGAYVFGIGKDTTPKSLKTACDQFIMVKSLLKKPSKKIADKVDDNKAVIELHRLIKEAYEIIKDNGGWAAIKVLGEQVKKSSPNFKIKSTGSAKYSSFLKKYKLHYKIKNNDKKQPTHFIVK